jgi:hypothetical protein
MDKTLIEKAADKIKEERHKHEFEKDKRDAKRSLEELGEKAKEKYGAVKEGLTEKKE